MRVLVIEDDRVLGEVFAEFLREVGHQPVVVHTAEAALDALRAEPPEAMLLDICLPGMSGSDLLKLQVVRELRIPTVVISGRATESQAQDCLQSGAFDFIGKPVALQRLAEALGCLESRPAARRPEAPIERRRAPRAPVALPVRAREPSGREWESTSVNLSTSGVKIRGGGVTRPGQETTLMLTLPDGETCLDVASVVVRADFDGCAFRFLNLSDRQWSQLDDLVRRSEGVRQLHVEPHLRILHLIGEAISASLDVDEVLRITLDALTQVTGHEISSLHLLSADGATLHLRGDRGLRPRLRELLRVLPAGQGVLGRAAASGHTVDLADLGASIDLGPSTRAVVDEEGIRAFVCVPVKNRGRPLGVLSLGRRASEPFTQSEITLVEASAIQIGLALANAQLHSDTRRQLEDLKVVEAQLIEGEKLSTAGKLASGLAHEIRNRLTTILGLAELSLMRPDVPATSRQSLHTIVEETSGATRLLENLLQFAGGHSAEGERCDLREQVEWVVELKGHELKRDGIQVVTELERVPAVLADKTRIQQVLLNLVQNAHQAMAAHAGPRVLTLRLVDAPANHVRLEVLDTGPGIPPKLLLRIFEAFSTTKPAGEGTGLGLWVSHAIIEHQRGTLRVENRPGGGARFVIELPAETLAGPTAA